MTDPIMREIIAGFEDRAEPEPPRESCLDDDGWRRGTDGKIEGNAHYGDGFAIDSEAKADWALQLRSEIEGARAGDLARLAALTANLQARIAAYDQELQWWDFRFSRQLEDFARAQLRGGKSRTLRLTWGSVAFRKTQGTHAIEDMESAVAWMRDRSPERIVTTEWVGKKDVLEVLGDGERPPWLESTGPGETVKISTGVETKEGKR